MTELRITPNLDKKSAKFHGTIAAGERVHIVIQSDVAFGDNLRFRAVSVGGKTLAQFPYNDDDKWDIVDGAYECDLNLNTVQMLEVVPAGATVPILFVLDDAVENTLYFKDFTNVTHWPRKEGEDIPVDLSGYVDYYKEIQDNISTIESQIKEKVDATAVDEALKGKQDALDEAQMDAVNSGVNSQHISNLVTIVGDDSGKSARIIAGEEVMKIVHDAPETYDTLKEIADWIETDKTGAALLADKIKDNKESIEEEVARAKQSESLLWTALSEEIERAKGAEEKNEEAINDNAQAISNEAARAIIAEEENAIAIEEEMQRAKAAEEELGHRVTSEEIRAKQAERDILDEVGKKLDVEYVESFYNKEEGLPIPTFAEVVAESYSEQDWPEYIYVSEIIEGDALYTKSADILFDLGVQGESYFIGVAQFGGNSYDAIEVLNDTVIKFQSSYYSWVRVSNDSYEVYDAEGDCTYIYHQPWSPMRWSDSNEMWSYYSIATLGDIRDYDVMRELFAIGYYTDEGDFIGSQLAEDGISVYNGSTTAYVSSEVFSISDYNNNYFSIDISSISIESEFYGSLYLAPDAFSMSSLDSGDISIEPERGISLSDRLGSNYVHLMPTVVDIHDASGNYITLSASTIGIWDNENQTDSFLSFDEFRVVRQMVNALNKTTIDHFEGINVSDMTQEQKSEILDFFVTEYFNAKKVLKGGR